MESQEGEQPLCTEWKRYVDAVAGELEGIEEREPHRHCGIALPSDPAGGSSLRRSSGGSESRTRGAPDASTARGRRQCANCYDSGAFGSSLAASRSEPCRAPSK